MGGHSKKSGKGGGGGSGRHSRQALQSRRKPMKALGVPDLKDVTQKLARTAQRRDRSAMSIPGLHQVKQGGAAVGGGRLLPKVLQSASAVERGPRDTGADLGPEEQLAKQRREMTTLALRTSEKVHDYEAPLELYDEDAEEGRMLEDVDRRGTDRSLRRFMKEFQSVVDHCDVLLQVVDARDPLGCRLTKIEQSIRSTYGEERKKIVIVLNKVDLLPSREVVDAWVHYLEEYEHIMCIPFAATAKGSSGQSYISTLYQRLRSLARGGESGERKAIVVGVIGYPNVGKSSVINALRRKNVVGVGNTPGFTTGTTEVELRADIRVMDCPGVVNPGEDNGDVVLRNAVKVHELANPFTPVQRLLERCAAVQPLAHAEDADGLIHRALRATGVHPLAQFYNIGSFPEDDPMEFIRLVGLRRGRLCKGGVVNEEETARTILADWNTGRIAYYTYPPAVDDFLPTAPAAPSGGHTENEEDVDSSPQLVSKLARGVTLDGLPVFHLWFNRGSTSKKTARKIVSSDDEDEL